MTDVENHADGVAKAVGGVDQAKLALDRTFLAHERTLMAWNRTAISMITFGFTLYKFFLFLHQDKPAAMNERWFGARTYGLCIMAIGVSTLLVAAWQHRRRLEALRVHDPEAPLSLALVLAVLMGTLGAVALAAAMFQI